MGTRCSRHTNESFCSEKHRGLFASVAVERYRNHNQDDYGANGEKEGEEVDAAATRVEASTLEELDSGAVSAGENLLETSAATTDSIRCAHTYMPNMYYRVIQKSVS